MTKLKDFLNEGKMDYEISHSNIGFSLKKIGDDKKRPDREDVGYTLIDEIVKVIKKLSKSTSLKVTDINDVVVKFK